MKLLPFLLPAAALISWCNEPPPPAPEGNVNSRYTVESVEFTGELESKLSRSLRENIYELVGQHFNPATVADFAGRIHRELKIFVTHRVERGLKPEHVKVIYEAHERRWDEDDARVTRLAYHHKQGWTGAVEVDFNAGPNQFEFGIGSDADRLLERYAGINAGYKLRLGRHVRFQFEADALHQIWNRATLIALDSRPDVPGIYRERYTMEPAVAVQLPYGFSVTAGVSISHFQTQFPAARFEAANAVITTLRHRRRWQLSGSSEGHELDAGYSLRAATSFLDSDYLYTRHTSWANYTLQHGRHRATLRLLGGWTGDRTPLFDRFALGDSHTLRGWNKFDVDPVGGTRAAHGSAQYQYRSVGVFYDTGSVWDRGESASAKHGVGVICGSGDGPFLALAFPLRSEGFSPLFILGMNF